MIAQYARTLAAYSDDQWAAYVMQREPLSGKLSRAERLELYRGAVACGREQAQLLPRGATVRQLAEEAGVPVKLDETVSDGVFTTFATYSIKDGITIFVDNARRTDALIEREGLDDLSGGVKTEDLLLAHEWFHVVEDRTSGLFTQQKHLLLFRIGRFERRSKVLSLGEVAAMNFAKELTGLPTNPYVYDVLMLYAKNPQRARQQFEQIQRVCERLLP